MSDNNELKLFSDDELDGILDRKVVHVEPKRSEKHDPHVQIEIVQKGIPRIAKNVKMRWGRPAEFYPYMNDLLTTDRAGRAGFPPPVLTALFALLDIHQMQVDKQEIDPRTGKPMKDIWINEL